MVIFSLNLNNYFNNYLQQLCLNSWNTYKIKIFNDNDVEYKEFYKLYQPIGNKYKNQRIEYLADAFRIYILAKYENYVGFDGDVYLLDNIYFNFNFQRTGYYLSNIGNIEFYKQLGNNFLNEKYIDMKDSDIFDSLNLKSNILNSNIIHLSDIKNENIKYRFLLTLANIDNVKEYKKLGAINSKIISDNNLKLCFITNDRDVANYGFKIIYLPENIMNILNIKFENISNLNNIINVIKEVINNEK